MVRQVGRPPERDSEGNVISKGLCNVTIPTKLKDFLSKNKINRSKLFTEVVTRLYMHQICPKCYNENIVNGIMALKCDDCNSIIKYKPCGECGEMYHRGVNMPKAVKNSSRFGCEKCL